MKKELCTSTVLKSNELIQRSRFSLTLQQQKIILYLISQIQPYDDDFKLYSFDIAEFCNVCGIYSESGKNYADAKKALKEIADKSLWITLDSGKQTLIRWIEKPYIDEKNGRLQVRLDKDMKPFLLKLRSNYTQYDLLWVLYFKCKYSIRLYELIKSVHYRELETYQHTFEVDELKRMIGAEEYTEFYDFKRKALLPAVEEINALSDKSVDMDFIKSGRSITGIRMTISSKSTAERLGLMGMR